MPQNFYKQNYLKAMIEIIVSKLRVCNMYSLEFLMHLETEVE